MTRTTRRHLLAMLVSGVLIGALATAVAKDGGSAPAPSAAPQPAGALAAPPAPPGVPVPGVPVPGVPVPGVPAPGLAAPLRADAGPPPAPVAIRIPAIGVDHTLVPLAVDPAGVLVPPVSPADPGWFTGSVVPGEIGPSIIAGHVDSRSGPGVFYRLGRLRVGDEIEVQRPDGVERFRVRSTQTIGKREFPTASVYGPVPVPELRLITCGGDFSRATGHYVDNVIVRADLVQTPMFR